MSELKEAWIVILVILIVLFVGTGVRIKGHYLGVLVDFRGKMSLARFQICLWTWLIASTVLAIAIVKGTSDITIPGALLALMGISAGSTAGSVIVKGTKAAKKPNPDKTSLRAKKIVDDDTEEREKRERLKSGKFANDAKGAEKADGPNEWPEGVLHCTDKPEISQMFKGEEISDHHTVDIAKVQMFVFTIVLAVGYAVVLWRFNLNGDLEAAKEVLAALKDAAVSPDAGALSAAEEKVAQLNHTISLPGFSQQATILLGISHGSYLAVKAAPKTPEK